MRLFLAICIAKSSAVFGRLIGKKSSTSPGRIALKIYPNLIKKLSSQISKDIIAVCGTNGKTTTNNLIYTSIKASGNSVICNTLGANMLSGIATLFALNSSVFGNLKADYACLEIDEANARLVFDHLQPDYMVITNLFRDQLDRYGEIDTTIGLINQAIDMVPDVKLIINADDPLCAAFGIGRPNTKYFGINESVKHTTEHIKEGRFCLQCGNELVYEYYHYSHLGNYKCTKCEFKRPETDYSCDTVQLDNGLSFDINGNHFNVNYRGFYNIYNILAVYSVIESIGLDTEIIHPVLNEYKPQIGRMEQFNFNKPVILNLSKNPAGFNQAIETLIEDTRKKDIIICINDNANDGRDVSWLWDADFEKLAVANTNLIIISGIRRYDMALRLKYSDISIDIIETDIETNINTVLKSDAEVCYYLINYSALFDTQTTLKKLLKDMQNERNDD